MLTALLLAVTLHPCDIALVGAHVWDGSQFIERGVFIGGDHVIAEVEPSQCEEVIDASGRFITPPFAEGHSHNVEAGWSFEGLNARYLEEGVFYVLNPLNMPVPANALASRLNEPGTIDVAFAHGALTSYHGHPEAVYVIALSSIMYGGAAREAFVGEAFHTVEEVHHIGPALDRLESQGADVVKIVISNAEDHAARSAYIRDETNWQNIFTINQDEMRTDAERLEAMSRAAVGLDPVLVPEIVREAHRRGMNVIAHVNTVFDFEVAAQSGVDTIVHMPGAYLTGDYTLETGTLTDAAIDAAARHGTGVVATASVRPSFTAEEDRPVLHQMQRENIRRLREAGVPVYIGTDRWQAMASEEVAYLIEIGAMTSREAFASWVATSQIVFPDRKIGRLDPGYEADMLVFDTDPTTGLEAMTTIAQRMKGGLWLDEQ